MAADNDLVLRAATAGNLTADETLTAIRMPKMVPLWLVVDVPTASALDTLDVELEFLDSSSAERYNLNMKQIGAVAGVFSQVFLCDPLTEKLQVKLNVTDGGGGVNYGAVVVTVVPGDPHVGGAQNTVAS